MQDLGYVLPRIPISRTSVNKGKIKGRGVMPQRFALAQRNFFALYFLTVKDHTFCCKPLAVRFWSRDLPATSLAPGLRTAL